MENKLNWKFMHISFCAELGNSAWQWFATHTQEYISFSLLHASSSASHVCYPFPWLLHPPPLWHYCPSTILRAVKRRSQHAVLPEAYTINTSSMEAHNLKSGLVARRLSYWKLNIVYIYPYYIQIYKYIPTCTHMYRWEKCDIIYRIR